MSRNPAEEVLNELIPYFEAIETQNAAIMQFLKDKGLATDEQLAPFLEQAAKASNVKWLGARLRMGRLFAVPESTGEPAAERKTEATAEQTVVQKNVARDDYSEKRESEDTTAKKSEPVTDHDGNETADKPKPSERRKNSDPVSKDDGKTAQGGASDKDAA